MISLIAAMSQNGVIGVNNQLPWHLSADLKRFKQVTMGKPIIMGRKTYESIGKPLPGRDNYVITRNKNFQAAGCIVTHSLTDAIKACDKTAEIMIMGGANIYAQALPMADKLYLTIIEKDYEGDTFFPDMNYNHWYETFCEQHSDNNFAYKFLEYTRKTLKVPHE